MTRAEMERMSLDAATTADRETDETLEKVEQIEGVLRRPPQQIGINSDIECKQDSQICAHSGIANFVHHYRKIVHPILLMSVCGHKL